MEREVGGVGGGSGGGGSVGGVGWFGLGLVLVWVGSVFVWGLGGGLRFRLVLGAGDEERET